MKPFSLSEAKLIEHFGEVGRVLSTVTGQTEIRLDEVARPDGRSIGIRNSAPCEPARRNRGGEMTVAPLLDLGGGISAWFGFREQWVANPRRKDVVTYRFSSCDLTVFFGRAGILSKPQLFRAEWVGLVDVRGDWVFEAGEAAHPHWQFDALESFTNDDERSYVRELRDDLRNDRSAVSEGAIEVKEFGAMTEDRSDLKLGDDDIALLVRDRKVSAIHFPSVAEWWHVDKGHAHYPQNAKQIRIWLRRTLSYVKVELSRV